MFVGAFVPAGFRCVVFPGGFVPVAFFVVPAYCFADVASVFKELFYPVLWGDGQVGALFG